MSLTSFLNKSDERCFNDALLRLIAAEIRLQSGKLDEDMILPTYFRRRFYYNGEYMPYAAPVKMILSKATMNEARQIVAEGSSFHLETYSEIRSWLQKRLPELKSGCLTAIADM
jgi:hypothetical protein